MPGVLQKIPCRNLAFASGAWLVIACLIHARVPHAQAGESNAIRIAQMRMAAGIDERYEPVGATEVFAAKTAKVYCWFRWEDAPPDTTLQARWTYLPKKIKIFEYPVSIPRPAGSGGIAMTMPKGRFLPPGAYRIELWDRHHHLVESLQFSVGT
jgi:hypothetical protein